MRGPLVPEQKTHCPCLATAVLVERAGLEDGVTDGWKAAGVFYDDLMTQGLIATP